MSDRYYERKILLDWRKITLWKRWKAPIRDVKTFKRYAPYRGILYFSELQTAQGLLFIKNTNRRYKEKRIYLYKSAYMYANSRVGHRCPLLLINSPGSHIVIIINTRNLFKLKLGESGSGKSHLREDNKKSYFIFFYLQNTYNILRCKLCHIP